MIKKFTTTVEIAIEYPEPAADIIADIDFAAGVEEWVKAALQESASDYDAHTEEKTVNLEVKVIEEATQIREDAHIHLEGEGLPEGAWIGGTLFSDDSALRQSFLMALHAFSAIHGVEMDDNRGVKTTRG
jgi:hypothetical protein